MIAPVGKVASPFWQRLMGSKSEPFYFNDAAGAAAMPAHQPRVKQAKMKGVLDKQVKGHNLNSLGDLFLKNNDMGG